MLWNMFSRRRMIAVAGLAAVAVSVALVSSAAADGSPPGGSAFSGLASGGGSRQVSLTSGPVQTVEVAGLPGQLTVTGAGVRDVSLTGPVQWNGPGAPRVTSRLDRLTGTLRLSSFCAPYSPCTGDYRLVVPRGTAVVLFQPSGHVVLTDLDGPVSISAASVDISASGLRSPSLTASLTSGHLSAVFAAPPRRLAVSLHSAQATITLPGDLTYAVDSQVTSGYLQNGLPESAAAARTISVRITSGEMSLLPG
jgi:hypothetical protein